MRGSPARMLAASVISGAACWVRTRLARSNASMTAFCARRCDENVGEMIGGEIHAAPLVQVLAAMRKDTPGRTAPYDSLPASGASGP